MNPADFLLDLESGNIHDISVPADLENQFDAEVMDNHGDRFPGSLSSHDVLEVCSSCWKLLHLNQSLCYKFLNYKCINTNAF